MPPKPKYTRDQVAVAAYEIVKTQGLSALTARELGKQLGTSASPIFTVFNSMEEVKLAARELALADYVDYVGDYQDYTPAFKRIGMRMVCYGKERPEQFKLLFMQEHVSAITVRSSMDDLGHTAEVCIGLICRDYGLSREEAQIMLEQMWTQTFGLAAMCALRVCVLSEEEIGKRLGVLFAGMMMLIRSGRISETYAFPEKTQDGIFHGRAVGDVPFVPNAANHDPEVP